MQKIIVSYQEDNVKSDRWKLERSVTFYTLAGTVTVPRGYITDFASVPMVFWGFFPPIGRHNRATLLHDWWYDNRLFESELGPRVARRLADTELYDRLKVAEPTKYIRNYIMYQACRWFGRAWWVD